MSSAKVGLIAFAGLLVLWVPLAPLCFAAPRYDDDISSLDRETLRDAVASLYQMLRVGDAWSPSWHQKRNSEIISTVLGLPKKITDAGRK